MCEGVGHVRVLFFDGTKVWQIQPLRIKEVLIQKKSEERDSKRVNQAGKARCTARSANQIVLEKRGLLRVLSELLRTLLMR